MDSITALASAAPTACPSCVFGAYSSQILSFTSSYISHITVSVTPHITVYTNGSRSTSFESNTLTKSEIVGGIAGSNASKTYSRFDDVTWTVEGATLTYPTKYVQYLGFSGGPAPTDDGDTCAEKTDASAISLPEITNAASFIYALPANATALALPTPLLQYLGGLGDLVDQLDGAALTGCAPLDGALQVGSNGSIPYPTAWNGSAGAPSGYAGPSSSVVSQLPSGYSGGSASNRLPTHSIYPSGYVESSSRATSSPPRLSTGYSGPGTGVASVPVMSILPVLSTSTNTSTPTSTASSVVDGVPSVATPEPYAMTTLTSSASSESSQLSQGSISESKLSILPHPYLNTTFSRSSTSSGSTSFGISATSSAIAVSSVAESVSLHTTARVETSTTTSYPGGVFAPSDTPTGGNGEQTAPSYQTATQSESGLPAHGNQPPNPGNGNDAGSSAVPISTSYGELTTQAPQPPAPASSPEASPPSSYESEGQNVHTTAFVIEPITGSALITYQSAPTTAGDDGKTLGGGGGRGSQGTGAEDTGNVAGPTGTAAHNPGDSDSPDTYTSGPDSTAPGSDESSGTSSPGHDTPGQDSPGENVGTTDQNSSDHTSNSNGGSDGPQNSNGGGQGIDLGQLNSAVNSVANGGAADGNNGGAQATSAGNAAPGSSPGSVYSAGNTVVTAQPGGAVIIGGQTIAPGQSITIGSGPSTTVVALQTGNGKTDLVVAGSTYEASPGNSAVTAQPDGAVVFGGSTVRPGQSVTIGSGPSATIVALQTDGGSTNLIVGGSTVQVLPDGGTITAAPNGVTGISSMALITTNGQTITAIQSGSSLILQSGSSTTAVANGEAATFAGETILAVPTDDAVFVNGNITPLTAAEGVEAASRAMFTANGHTITAVDAGSSVLLVEGSVTKTLQDGSDVVFQGQTISAQESGMAVVVNGHTSSLTSAIAFATGQAVVTAGGHTFSALDLPGYVVLQDGTISMTISDSATATFEGQKITALSNGDAVVVDGHTMSMTEPVELATAQALITAGGHTFTALDMDGYIILEDGTTMLTVKDGQTATFDDQTIRALASGEAVVVNGRTTSFTSVEASATPDVNEYINKGLSGGSTSSRTVGAASAEHTDGGNANAASMLSMGWTTLVVTCSFGIVAILS